MNIQQSRIIKSMLDAGEIVIAVGGGGIPVAREDNHDLRGVEAVIDKDPSPEREMIITLPEFAVRLFEGKTGTRIIR